jgi:hypothetical protein
MSEAARLFLEAKKTEIFQDPLSGGEAGVAIARERMYEGLIELALQVDRIEKKINKKTIHVASRENKNRKTHFGRTATKNSSVPFAKL